MVRLLLFAVIAVGLWYLWRVLRRHASRISESLGKAEESLAKKKSVELEKDPETGVYRPTDRRD